MNAQRSKQLVEQIHLYHLCLTKEVDFFANFHKIFKVFQEAELHQSLLPQNDRFIYFKTKNVVYYFSDFHEESWRVRQASG